MIPWSEKTFNVSEIAKKIKGVTYLSKFYFKLLDDESKLSELLTNGVNGTRNLLLEDLYFYSDNITIPSRGLNTEAYTYANGFRFEVPTGTNYGDGNINVNMMVDVNYDLYNIFINWMDKIHSKETGFFSFHNKYTIDVRIMQLSTYESYGKDLNEFVQNVNSDSGLELFKVDLVNCYPKAVSAIEFRHDAKNMVKFNVNFSYEKINYFGNIEDRIVSASAG